MSKRNEKKDMGLSSKEVVAFYLQALLARAESDEEEQDDEDDDEYDEDDEDENGQYMFGEVGFETIGRAAEFFGISLVDLAVYKTKYEDINYVTALTKYLEEVGKAASKEITINGKKFKSLSRAASHFDMSMPELMEKLGNVNINIEM